MTTIDYPDFVTLLGDVARAVDAVLDSDDMDDVITTVADLDGIDIDVEPGEPGEQEALEAEDRIRARAVLVLMNELVQRHGLVDYVSITIPTA